MLANNYQGAATICWIAPTGWKILLGSMVELESMVERTAMMMVAGIIKIKGQWGYEPPCPLGTLSSSYELSLIVLKLLGCW